jgi:ubiquinone biosynthesis protein UbiJ
MSLNAIELLAKPLQAVLDHGVSRSTTAAALCQRLEGKSFVVQTPSAAMQAGFVVVEGRLEFSADAPAEPDAIICGTPLYLAQLAGQDPEAVIRAGHVSITGDAEVAGDFQALLGFVRPDLEEELSRFTGDAVAHETGRAARGILNWAQRAKQSVGRSVAEYLTEESRDLISATEHDEFCTEVDQLSSAVDRCAARLKLLREQRGTA